MIRALRQRILGFLLLAVGKNSAYVEERLGKQKEFPIVSHFVLNWAMKSELVSFEV